MSVSQSKIQTQKLYGVAHALCEIAYYRNVTDALYTHFFCRCGAKLAETATAAALIADDNEHGNTTFKLPTTT